MSADIHVWFSALLFANVLAVLWVVAGKRLSQNRESHPLPVPKNKITNVDFQTKSVFPVHIVWHNVSCVHSRGRQKRVILKNVRGEAEPGAIVALLGPSGAGKSTLLDILSIRNTTGTVSGTILFNGVQQGQRHLQLVSYIPQDDLFMPCLSCLETIQFYAGLLLRDASTAEKQYRIQDVLQHLDLTQHQHTIVGGMLPGGIRLKGLSGGQKRRLNIAIGLISSPSIVFMDEPTSGLDSFAAASVMHFIKDLALNRRHTILVTIHQPRLDIWRMFSKGNLMYTGTTVGVYSWFSSYLRYPYDAEQDGTIPDWCLDLISIDFSKPQGMKRTIRTEEELLEASRAFLSAGYAEDIKNDETLTFTPLSLSDVDPSAESGLQNPHLPDSSPKTTEDMESAPSNHSRFMKWILTFCRHFILLAWRSGTFIVRNPAAVGGRLFTISWVAAAVGVVFYNIPDTPQSIATRFNVLFMSTLVLILLPYLSVSHATADKVYYLNDMRSRLYQPFVYYISKAVVQLPFQLMNVVVFVLIVYHMTGLRSDAGSLFKHLIILTFAFLIFSQILSLAAVVAPSEDLTFIIGVCFVAFNLMFSDFFIRKDQMRFSWLGHLSTASPMKYIFEALTEIEFRDRDYVTPCVHNFEEEYLKLSVHQHMALPYPKEVISYVLRSMSDEDGWCLVSGNGLLRFLGHQRSVSQTLLILSVFLLCMHLATFLLLCYCSMYPSKK